MDEWKLDPEQIETGTITLQDLEGPNTRLSITPSFHFEGFPAMPNRWHRFWQWLLLGWRWEKLDG